MRAPVDFGSQQPGSYKSLFLVCEVGTSGKKALRAFLNRGSAQGFLDGKSHHLFRLEECAAPEGYAPPMEVYAAHTYDADYGIHRFTGLCRFSEEAARLAGHVGLVVTIIPEE